MVLAFVFSTVMMANSVNGQKKLDTKVNISINNLTLFNALAKIEKTANVKFSYNSRIIQLNQKVSINAKDEALSSVLNEILEPLNIDFIEVSNQIVLHNKSEKENVVNSDLLNSNKFEDIIVKGKVTDANGAPLPGASILVKGTKISASTDFDGGFSIKIPENATRLVISYIGMKTREVDASTKFLTIVLSEDSNTLSEVVITGYQKISTKLFTGSATQLKMEDIKLEGVADISRSLQGQVAGVEIENVSGAFGTAPVVRVRGNASINGNNKPLWVIDGVTLEDAVELSNEDITSGNLNTILSSPTVGISPEDVESFQILKDASATALYGARAMNGVIVINTKKGKSGSPKITYSESLTVKNRPNYGQFDILTSGDEMSVYQEQYEKGWMDIAKSNQSRNHGALQNMFYNIANKNIEWGPDGGLNYKYLQRYADANTDWFKVLFKNSISKQRSFSISSGTDKASIRASIGMFEDDGQTIADKVKNYTASIRSDFNISDKFRIGTKLAANIRDQQLAASENRKFNAIDGVYERNFDINPFNYALYTARSITPYDENGNREYFRRNWAPFNILHEIENNKVKLAVSDISLQTDFDYKITHDLTFNTVLQGRWYKSDAVQSIHENSNNAAAYRADNPLIRDQNIFLFDDQSHPELEPYSILPNGGFRKTTSNTLNSYSVRNSLSYQKNFNSKHDVNALFGQEICSNDRTENYFEGWGFVFDKGGLVLSDPNFIKFLDSRGEDYFKVKNTRNRSWGTFLNAGYAYDSRYVINGTFRYDGDNRTGKSRSARYLPTWNISGAWNIHNEEFMKNIPVINTFRIKSTYGLSGDNPVNASAALILKGAEPLRPQLSDRETALLIEELENSELSFEKLYEFNVGTEISAFNNRLSIDFEYYKRKSKDLLGRIETSGVGGIQYKYGNIGEMSIDGYELTLNTVNIKTINFNWNTSFNFSTSENEITKWESRDRIGDAVSRNGANIQGYPRGALFSIPFAGLDANGVPTFKDKDGGTVQNINLQERDKITDYLKYEGSTTPKGFGGLTNNFRYKNIDLNIGLSYRYGNVIRLDDVYKSNYSDSESLPGDLINRWQLPGDENITNIPAILTTTAAKQLEDANLNPYELYNKSDQRIAKGDFVRIKSIRIGYRVPNNYIKNTFITGMNISLSAYNLWLLYSDAKLKGIDPEFYQSGGVSLPLAQTYTFTLNLNF